MRTCVPATKHPFGTAASAASAPSEIAPAAALRGASPQVECDPCCDEGGVVGAPRKHPEELRLRAVRMVGEVRAEDPRLSLNGAVTRVGLKLVINSDTLRGWCKQADVDTVAGSGTALGEQAALVKSLQKENRELERANEILLAASSFFARELDPRLV